MDKHYGKPCHSNDPRSLSNAILESRRIYRREWKRNKPYLAKSTSLPVLQLIPSNRPLFWCRQCGFMNTSIPLCLWCCWTSQEAHDEFERSMPRVRRVTAPPRVYWKRHLLKNDDSYVVKPPGIIPRQSHSATLDHPSIGFCFDTDFSIRQYDMKFVLVPRDENNETLLPYSLPAFEKSRAMDPPGKVLLQSLFLDDGYHEEASWARRAASSHTKSPLKVLKTISTKSLRSSNLFTIDLNAAHDSYELPNAADFTPGCGLFPSQTPLKTLRRKKRFSCPRPSTETVLHSSTPSGHSSRSSPLLTSWPVAATSLDGHQNDYQHTSLPNNLRLGHPSRPYYTAIRPSMSRSTSPTENFSPFQSVAATAVSDRSPGCTGNRHMSLPLLGRPSLSGIFSMHNSSTSLTCPAFAEYRASETAIDWQNECDDGELRKRCLRSPFPRLFSMSLPKRGRQRHLMDRPPAPCALAGIASRNRNQYQYHRPGFSLSGETELRMALAANGEGNDDLAGFGVIRRSGGDFRFKDMSKNETKMARKMNELKRGFWELVKKKPRFTS